MKSRIVYVDDDPNWAYALPEIGKLIGYDIVSVQSSDEFLEILSRGEHIDLFITDIRLPKQSGYDLIGEYRSRFPDFPVMILTGYNTKKLKKFATANKINSLLLKPIPILVIQQELDSLLK